MLSDFYAQSNLPIINFKKFSGYWYIPAANVDYYF